MKALIIILAGLFALNVTQSLVIANLATRVRAMEAIVINNAVEANFLSRKMEELKKMNDAGRDEHADQLQFAIAGFRSGNYHAYEKIVASREGL